MRNLFVLFIGLAIIFITQNSYGFNYNVLCKPCKDIESYHLIQTVVTGDGKKINYIEEWWMKPGLFRREFDIFKKNKHIESFLFIGSSKHCYERKFLYVNNQRVEDIDGWHVCKDTDFHPLFLEEIICNCSLKKEFKINHKQEKFEFRNWYQNNLLSKRKIKRIDEAGRLLMITNIELEYNEIYSKELFEFPNKINMLSGGIGIELVDKNGIIEVQKVIKESPAEKANICQGDILIKINDEEVTKKSIKDIIWLLRGPVDSLVKIEILRNDKKVVSKLKRQCIIVSE